MGLLIDRWEQVEEGLGQVVLISGEPWIGKSRLLQGIYDDLEGRPHSLLVHRCSPYHQNSPLFPIIGSIERRLEDYSVQVNESIQLSAGLLSLPLDHRYSPLNLSPQRQ